MNPSRDLCNRALKILQDAGLLHAANITFAAIVKIYVGNYTLLELLILSTLKKNNVIKAIGT